MLKRFFAGLGLTEEQMSAKELNGKFIAILRNSGRCGDPQIIKVPEKTIFTDGETTLTLDAGDILAHENPIHIQELAEQLYPEFAGENNPGGKHILFCYIPKSLSCF